MTAITENHPKWQLYSQMRKCGEIAASSDGRHFGLNCSYCPAIFTWTKIKDFLKHLNRTHKKELLAKSIDCDGLRPEKSPPLDVAATLGSSKYNPLDDEDSIVNTITISEEKLDFVHVTDEVSGDGENNIEVFTKEEPFESDHNSECESKDDEMSSTTNSERKQTGDETELDLSAVENHEPLSCIIEMHRQNPILWDTNHIYYTIHMKKLKFYNDIVRELNSRFKLTLSVANIREIFKGLRKLYSTELFNVERSKTLPNKNTKKTQTVTPQLWCFNQLDFLRDQELAANSSLDITDEQLLHVADIYHTYPMLWDLDCLDSHSKVRQIETLRRMLLEANEKMNLNMTLSDLRSRVTRIKTIYRENKRRRLKCEQVNVDFVSNWPELYEKLQYLEPFTGSFRCEICYKEVLMYHAFKSHMAEHEGRMAFTCSICKMEFRLFGNYEIHMRRHAKETPFLCSYCDQGFVTSTELKHHVTKHTGERPFVCDACGLSYRTSSLLLNHRKNRHNTNRERFQCPQCPKSFLGTRTLRDHMNTHEQLRCHVCPVCGKGFYARKTMRQHCQLHDEVKKYQCELCDKDFAQKSGLFSHKRAHHKIAGFSEQ